MACVDQSNRNNFLVWHKVTGTFSLSDLQANGYPDPCSNLPVSAPQNLQATSNENGQITLTWDATPSSSGNGFYIYRSTNSTDGFEIIDDPVSSVTETYIDVNVDTYTTYYYKLRSFSTVLGDFSNTANGQAILTAPSALSTIYTLVSDIYIMWTSNSSGAEEGFSIERSTRSGSGFKEVATVLSGVTEYYDDELIFGTYYYRVRAIGNNGGYSDYSNELEDKPTKLPAPSNLVASEGASTGIDLTWTLNSAGLESGVEVQRSNIPFSEALSDNNFGDNDFGDVDFGNGIISLIVLPKGTTSYSDGDNNPNTVYYYRVRALRSTGNSNYSNTDSAQYTTVTVQFGDNEFGNFNFGDEF